MVTPLVFKGDKPKKKPKKRKRTDDETITKSEPSASQGAIATDPDDLWTNPDHPTHITGPTILVLSTTPPSTLATDPNGKIYPSLLHNVIDGNPSTAEPHAVSQVWVANRIAGGEAFTFKGSNGKYLSCDKVGVLGAQKEAVGPEEQWTIDTTAKEGLFTLKAVRGSFLGVEPKDEDHEARDVERLKLRGDNEAVEGHTMIRIRMQAKFKPRVNSHKQDTVRETVSRRHLEDAVGRKLEDDEVRMLKRAKKEGNYHEAMVDIKVKGKSDKFA